MSGILTVQSGTPFSVRLATDSAGTGTSTTTQQRPDFKPGPDCPSPNAVDPGHPERYIKLQCFSYPAAGTIGNLGRNTLRSPNVKDVDFSLFKNHELHENLRLQFRVRPKVIQHSRLDPAEAEIIWTPFDLRSRKLDGFFLRGR